MAAAMPDGLLGPGGKTILPAGYEGYSGGSWSELLRDSPMTAKYMIVLFRMYGIYCVVVGLMGAAIAATAFRRGALGVVDAARRQYDRFRIGDDLRSDGERHWTVRVDGISWAGPGLGGPWGFSSVSRKNAAGLILAAKATIRFSQINATLHSK
jgi:hypothetical protein